jgi:RNA polymerase sigma-70 factor (ECF subfamily)
MDFEDFRVALLQLAPDQREALILVGASGLSYEEAAEICGCAVGTIKSRVNRARGRLGELLGLESGNEAPTQPRARGRQIDVETTDGRAVASRG